MHRRIDHCLGSPPRPGSPPLAGGSIDPLRARPPASSRAPLRPGGAPEARGALPCWDPARDRRALATGERRMRRVGARGSRGFGRRPGGRGEDGLRLRWAPAMRWRGGQRHGGAENEGLRRLGIDLRFTIVLWGRSHFSPIKGPRGRGRRCPQPPTARIPLPARSSKMKTPKSRSALPAAVLKRGARC